MYQINENYQKLPGSYLFSTIAKKVNAFTQANPDKNIIRLGIGDVTQPIAPAIIEALHKAVDEMADPATFHGYAPDLGYDFLRNAIVKNDYQARGCDISFSPFLNIIFNNTGFVSLIFLLLLLLHLGFLNADSPLPESVRRACRSCINLLLCLLRRFLIRVSPLFLLPTKQHCLRSR